MKIAVTGCNGHVGRPVVELALRRGHTVVGLDYIPQAEGAAVQHPQFTFVQADLKDYEVVLRSLEGSEGVVHLAAYRDPTDYGVTTHNGNVVISWNILRACAELKINRIAQASSVNVITMVFSQNCKFEYFPIDESHPCLPDEPYGLSKVICELQADTIVRRHPSMRIASLRLHWSIPNPSSVKDTDPVQRSKDLWGYLQEDSGADAFLLALTGETGKWSGHEAFFITAPVILGDGNSQELRQKCWPDVPIRDGKDVSGRKGFFDCGKAQRLLGWVHRDNVES
ncbi:hypothetical protein FPV67DRAFT_916627 [Lyophyllum atratum]|nr:hypothetical protein FPV67DRAFT_916627 [Lyophyllum atratum]